jgi:glucokinase
MFLGIEIGGTKLQLGLGRGDGQLCGLWRGTVDPSAGADGIRRQITTALPDLLASTQIERSALRGVGVGFGGPTDDATQSVIKSHHVAGWEDFPLADWVTSVTGLPAVICNDADVAGLAEALHGAGKGLSPVFYMTIGSGIGGGLILNREIYRGLGKGASEIGHLTIPSPSDPADQRILEAFASGWGIETRAEDWNRSHAAFADLGDVPLKVKTLAAAAQSGHANAIRLLNEAVAALAFAICQLIPLVCPRRIVIGGGVSLIGEDLLFEPLRRAVADRVFAAFSGLTDIVPAALGEEVVVHGALALARKRFWG